jgi:hypothetical protein
MPFADKQGLETEVVTWMARDDIAPNVASCITLAEAYFNRRLRVRQQESVIELTPTGGSVTVPDNYLAWRRLTWLGNPEIDLEYVVPSILTRQYSTLAAGVPRKFTIEGEFMNIRPVDDATNVEFNYYAKVPPLTQPADTNWLLDAYPDMYLAGTLAWVNTLVQNNEQFQIWLQACDTIIERAMLLSEKTKGPSAIQIAGPAW